MWQKKVMGVLGIWIIFLTLVGFSDSFKKVLLVATGIFIASVSFFGKRFIRPPQIKEHAD